MGKTIIFTGKKEVLDPKNEMLRLNAMLFELYKNGTGSDSASINVWLSKPTQAIISTDGIFSNGSVKLELNTGLNTIEAKVVSGNKAIIQILDAEENLTRIDGGSDATDDSPTFIINLLEIVQSVTEIETQNSVNLFGDINNVIYLTNLNMLSCQMPEASSAFKMSIGITGELRTNMPDNIKYLRINGNSHTFIINTWQLPRNVESFSFTCRNASLYGDVNDLPKTPIGACSIRLKNNPNGLLSNLPPNITSWSINTSNMNGAFRDLNNTIDEFNVEGDKSFTPDGDLNQMTNNVLNRLLSNAETVRYTQSRTWAKPIELVFQQSNMDTADLDRLFIDLDKVTDSWTDKRLFIRGSVSDASLAARNSLISKGATITIINP